MILFLEKMELYTASGLALNKSLRIIAAGAPKKRKPSVTQAVRAVENGGLLAKSLEEYLGASKTVAALLERGETAGELVKALGQAKALMEREDDLYKKCASAMVYPVAIGVFALLLTIGLVRGVMPQIIPMLKGLNVQLPLLTRIVMFASDNLLAYGPYIFLSAGMCVIVAPMVYKKIAAIRAFCHFAAAVTPLAGKLVVQYSLSVSLRSCGSLVNSGMSVAKAYADVTETTWFLPLKVSLALEGEQVARGVPLGVVFAGIKHLPEYIAPLVIAGEASGSLGDSLIRAADILDRDIEHSLRRLTALIEPVMMAGMGCVVGAIALSIMMPIYDISKVLQH